MKITYTRNLMIDLKFYNWIILFYFLILTSVVIHFGCERLTDANQNDDGIPPAVPTGVRIYYASDGEILVEWNSNFEADLKGYNVYRKTNKTDYFFLSFTKNSYWFDDSLSYDEKYFYKISAVDIWEQESERSIEVSAIPINRYNPKTPRYISINARNWEGKISVYLDWEPSTESDVVGYNIYRNLNSSFNADSTNQIGFTNVIQFNDTNNIQLYKDYYYKIRAVDKGGWMSEASSLVNDQIYDMSAQIFPSNDSLVNYFTDFMIKAVKAPANYRVIVQTNEYFGEFWSTSFSSSIIDDTIKVKFNPPYLYPYFYYYWRVITYSNNNSEPNSISPIYKFKVKP